LTFSFFFTLANLLNSAAATVVASSARGSATTKTTAATEPTKSIANIPSVLPESSLVPISGKLLKFILVVKILLQLNASFELLQLHC
jgi:hypothetical protein